MTTPLLSFDAVSKTYEAKAGPLTALESFDLTVAAGESVVIIGPSGCGKSTSLLLAAGLLQPSTGHVVIKGQEITVPRLETALILQDFGLLPWKTIFDNAALGLLIRHIDKKERRERVMSALEQVGLAEFASAYPSELSGGMRQRLALARVLALDADLLLMDEPLSSIDALLREGLQDMLLELKQARGYAQVLVTHSIEEAVLLGQRIVIMTARPGRVHTIIENPGVGAPEYRNDPHFHELTHAVRSLLDEGSQATLDPQEGLRRSICDEGEEDVDA